VSKDDASSSIITSSSFKLSSVVLSVRSPCSAQFSAIAYPYTLISLSLSSASPSISALSYFQYSKSRSFTQIHPRFFVLILILSVFIFFV
jgi:hypothetical protein